MAPNCKDDKLLLNDDGVDVSILNGRVLASPDPGEEVCITGISGLFPNSRNIQEYRDNLMNKIDMVDGDSRRWKFVHPEIPKRMGKIYDVQKFDPGFFGIHHRQVDSMDPTQRHLLERAIEAIFDAGLHPSELEGTNTGVFVGTCNLAPERHATIGCFRSMLAHRLSYYLKLKGLSHVTDTACSSSLYAVEHAYRAIRTGMCEKAFVLGSNLIFHPFLSLQFSRLGVLSLDGRCKSFDDSGNGYTRSEAINCILLQKAKDSRRIYATIVHAKTNCDGYKDQGITYPSGEAQTQLLKDFYTECNVDPTSLSFIEAHGTGTAVGDPEECSAIEEVLCKGRKEPLLIGSVKSNIGHSEPASGLCSIIKCIIGMEEGIIPPNIHYQKPRQSILALVEGRMKVVSEKTPFQDDRGLIGLNSFGFGGANCHVLLKWNTKLKIDGGRPKDDLPRLLCFSGRTQEAVDVLIDDVTSRKLDVEHIQLLHEVFKKDIHPHPYRGYTIVSKEGEMKRSLRRFDGVKPPLVLAFGYFEESWQHLAESLLQFPVFAASIQRVHDVLSRVDTGLNMIELITNQSNKIDPVLRNILGNLVTHIGIIDILKEIKLVPDILVGYALGELACAYYYGSLSLDQVVLAAYEISLQLKNINEPSSTYIVHLPEAEVRKLLPTSIEIIWSNRENLVAITGATKITQKSVDSLKDIGVVVKHINSVSVSWHTKKIAKIEPALLPVLKKIIPKPKQRSKNWLSASTEEVASPEYFIKALLSPIDFRNLSDYFEKDQVILEVGLGWFAEILEHFIDSPVDVIKFENDKQKEGVLILLQVLGSLYEYGYNPQIQNLYPKVQYPVGRGTPMISSKIRWDHSKDWFVMFYKETDSMRSGERQLGVTLKQEDFHYLSGHVIDGRNLFPATGYLEAVWGTLVLVENILERNFVYVFENCRFKRATTISKDITEFTIMIQRHSGNFEVIEGGADVVSGRIYSLPGNKVEHFSLPMLSEEKRSNIIPMKNRDIYKELRLRGYNYKGAFRGIEQYNHETSIAWLKWDGNWVSFMDNMLQIKILQLDSRLLYVPTSIKKMTIDSKRHMEYVKSFGDNPVLPVYIYEDKDIIRCGGVEIMGLKASSIPRRKQQNQPVLEKYQFIPNNLQTASMEKSLRVNMQIGLENLHGIKLKVVELLDEATKQDSTPLGPLVHEIFCDQPLIQTNIIVLSSEKLELSNVTVENKKLTSENECDLVIGTNLLRRTMILQQAFGALKENGFVLSREDMNFEISALSKYDLETIDILTIHQVGSEKLVYFRSAIELKEYKSIEISEKDQEYSWLPILQTSLEIDHDVVIYSQNEEYSGILGLFNCIRREPGGNNVKCFIILDETAPPFDLKHPFYAVQMKRNMSVNIYKNGQWGTYRHLQFESIEEVETEHCFVNPLIRGDLSSLRWIEGSLTSKTLLPPEKTLVKVHFASLNFRDVMTASGRLNADVITMDRIEQECVQGVEFSGTTSCGRKVMGMVTCGALSTLIAADSYLLWDIPEGWTLEQAATIPVVYGTVLYAMVLRGKIKKGNTVLIHSGTGGVGQAAISIALAYGCTVYTTVGTKEKREFIKKLFPQLTDRHIGSSRDLSFEKMIKHETRGRGVDIVLNSLAEEKLLASVRCLGKGGRFLEIGKFDLSMNNSLNLLLMSKNCSFHGIMLDRLFTAQPFVKKTIGSMIKKGIENGSVRPLSTKIFKMDEIEQAFRFMAAGKHMGKVLIEIRKEETSEKDAKLFKAIPRVNCDENKTYIIVGGLGGFGLELADWLIIRGARKLILTSRSGVQTGYQSYRIELWKSYGVQIKISTADITTKEGCEQLISEAQDMGPIDSIFNLAVVLKDSLLENQSPESFRISLGPKALATKYLDEITRMRCPDLRDFVVFSSVSCGRGNAGQTNYGMANSIMERICERRRLDGYPALAIEWGAIGDVGLVAEMAEDHTEMEIGGTLQQRITSCLHVMDTFLKQKEAAIVSSMVVATKKSGNGGADNIVDAVANILGIKKESVSPHTTLAELGLDSMTVVEIRQTLERDFQVFLTAQDIRTLTFSRSSDLLDTFNKLKKEEPSKESNQKDDVVSEASNGVFGLKKKPTSKIENGLNGKTKEEISES